MRPGIKTTLALAAVFFAVWLGLKLLFPLFSPFLLGAALALAAEPIVSFLHKRARIPRAVCSGIGVSMSFCFLAILLLLVCAAVVRELRALAGILPDLEETTRSGISLLRSWLLELAGHTPKSIQPLLQENVNSILSDGASLLDQAVRYGLSLAGNLLSHVPDSALGLGTAAISGFMISAKLPRIRAWLTQHIPRERLRPLLDALARMKGAMLGWLLAQIKLMGVTFAILTLGLLLLRVPYAPLWALGISLVDALPVLGTGTILIPWAFVSFLQANSPRAIGLVSVYIAVTLTRSALEPRLLGRHLGLDPLVTLMAMYAGFQLWGIGGMILAPLLAVSAVQLVPISN